MTKKDVLTQHFPDLTADEVRQLCYIAYFGDETGVPRYLKQYRKSQKDFDDAKLKLQQLGYLQTHRMVSPDCCLDVLDYLDTQHPEWIKTFKTLSLCLPTHTAAYLLRLAALVRNDDFEAAARLTKPYEGLGRKIFNVYAYIRKRAIADPRYATLLTAEQTLEMTTETLSDLAHRGNLDTSSLDSIRRMVPCDHPLYPQLKEQTDLYEFLLTGKSATCDHPKTMWALSQAAIRELYAGNVENALNLFREAAKSQRPRSGCLPLSVLNYFYAICIVKYRRKYGTNAITDVLDALHSATPVRVRPENFSARMLLEYAEANTENALGDVQRRAGQVLGYIEGNLDKCLALLTIKFFGLSDKYVEMVGPVQPALNIMQHELAPYTALSAKAKETLQATYGGPPLLANMHRKAAWEMMLSEIDSSVQAATDERPRRIIYFMQGRDLSSIMEQAQQPDGQWQDTCLLSVTTMCSAGYDSMDLLDSRIAMELTQRQNAVAAGRECATDADILIPLLADTGRVFIAPEYVQRTQANIVHERPRVEFTAQGDKIDISSNARIGIDGKPQRHTVTVVGDRYTLVTLNPLQRDILGKLLARQSLPASAAPSLRKTIQSLGGIMDVKENILSLMTRKAFESDGRLAVRIEPVNDSGGTDYRITFLAALLPDGTARLFPTIGEEYVYDEDEAGRTHCVHRNLAKEQENYQALVDFAQQFNLEFSASNVTQVGDERTLLHLLAFCHQSPERYFTEWPDGQTLKFKGTLTEADIHIEVRGNNDWFAVEGTAKAGVDILKLDKLVEACCHQSYDGFVRIGEDEYVRMTDTLRRRIAQLDALLTTGEKKTKGVPKYLVGALATTLVGLRHTTDHAYAEFRERMKAAYQTEIAVPEGLNAKLRPYQEEGFRWMSRLDMWGAGACLADDMGLGKTLQALTFLLSKADRGPSLVVAPKSVIPNWVNEARRFAPTMQVAVLNDTLDRSTLVAEAGQRTLVLSTYGVLTTEAQTLASRQWNVVCLDEAQQIKNRNTMVSRAAMALQAQSRILLTGTPLQNHVGELWNLMQFLNPGLLGRWNVFRDTYANGEMDSDHRDMLREMTQPFILRRTKQEVLTDLPEKIESTYYVTLNDDEASVYETMRERVELKFKKNKTKAERSLAKLLELNYFEELMKLRLASCDMHLLHDRWRKQSTKIEALMEILQTLMSTPANNILVFSQFTSFLSRIKPEVKKHQWEYLYLDGQTPMAKRQAIVEEFQSGQKRLFLSSLKAGGLGINLTRANYVILLDPWWNPAIEQQATDRAHRIGQQRCVSVIRLVSQHTIEEKILKLHEKKQTLSDDMLYGTADSYKLDYDDILEMVTPF